jgi:hypothetical protein
LNAPTGLREAGTKLWVEMHELVAEAEFEFDQKDLHLLELACRQTDDITLLEEALADGGLITLGSQGQPVLSRIVTELRGQRESVARLLRQIDWPGEEKLTASEKARKAAATRWGNRPSPTSTRVRALPEAR